MASPATSLAIPPAEETPPTQEGKLFVGLGVGKGNITVAMLREHFAKFGEVAPVVQPKHKRTGRPRGFAFVHFKRSGDAQRALAADPESHVIGRWKLNVKKVAEQQIIEEKEQVPNGAGTSYSPITACRGLPVDYQPMPKSIILNHMSGSADISLAQSSYTVLLLLLVLVWIGLVIIECLVG